MHILVKIAQHEYFIVVAYGLTLEELLWLFESSLVLLDLISLCVENETIGDPAVVAAENKDL